MKRIFELQREEEVRGQVKLHNEELHNLCVHKILYEAIKSIRKKCVGNVAHVNEEINMYQILTGKPEGNRLFENLCRRTTPEENFKEMGEKYGLNSLGSSYRPLVNPLEQPTETLYSIKYREFLE